MNKHRGRSYHRKGLAPRLCCLHTLPLMEFDNNNARVWKNYSRFLFRIIQLYLKARDLGEFVLNQPR